MKTALLASYEKDAALVRLRKMVAGAGSRSTSGEKILEDSDNVCDKLIAHTHRLA